MTAVVVSRLGGWVGVAVGASLMAPSIRPLDPTVRPLADAIALGCLVGGSGFLLVARQPRQHRTLAPCQMTCIFAREANQSEQSAIPVR